jgi:hypothetical protein
MIMPFGENGYNINFANSYGEVLGHSLNDISSGLVKAIYNSENKNNTLKDKVYKRSMQPKKKACSKRSSNQITHRRPISDYDRALFQKSPVLGFMLRRAPSNTTGSSDFLFG